MSDMVKKDPGGVVDNFAGWDDGIEGDDAPENAGLIQGTLVKFTNEGKWITRDGEEIPPDQEFIANNVERVVQKWQDRHPVETMILQPHQKFPDIEKMNEETPREEWIEGPDGNERGPWQGQHFLYWIDPKTMDKYTFPTGTIGGRIGVRDLRDKVVWMRRYKGANVYAVITLSSTFFNTRYGGRQRPHFIIKRWVRLGGGEGEPVEALPAPSTPPTATAAAPVLVQEPSLAEEMNDALPDDLAPPAQSAPKPTSPPKTSARRDLKKNPQRRGAPTAGRKRNILDAG